MEDNPTVIDVNNLYKTFRLPHEKINTIKSYIVNFWRRKKGYEEFRALRDVTFSVKKGEFFGIVGKNGSGKSTLLKILAGIYYPDQGKVLVEGKITPFIELGVGFSPELTGRENVFLNGALLGFSRKEMHAMYKDIVGFAELEKFMDQKLKNYSSGMQVRLAFSIAVRAKGGILLLDEVLAVGDAAFQQKCYDYFEELKREKKTVVFVSHDMTAIRRFCTRVICIKNGKIVFEGDPAEAADIYQEENMETSRQATKGETEQQQGNSYKVDISIHKQTDAEVNLKINFESKKRGEVFAGISLLKDGQSVAEINTMKQLKLKNKGSISYTLSTTVLNPGTYQVSAALFTRDNKQLVAVCKRKPSFILKDVDRQSLFKGAIIKLPDTWESLKN